MKSNHQPKGVAVHADASWKLLYVIGSGLALAYVIMVIVPLVLVFAVPRPPAVGGEAVLNYIASHKGVYLTELICFVGLSAPALGVFLAVAISLKDVNQSLAALGGLVGIVSEVLALALGSSPQSLSGGLVYLSDQYMATSVESQRVALATAAEGFLANANAVSPVGVLTALGILLLSLCMLRGIYHRGVAWLGITTGALGMAFEALRPQLGIAYGIYGLLLPAWFIAVGIELHKIGRPSSGNTAGETQP
jgi:hypothetical protein